jgi:excisionase family DNA binding protein
MDAQQISPEPKDGRLLDGWLTRQELAAQIGVSPDTLQRWANRRHGPPYVRIGRKVLYRTAAVQDWLVSRERVGRRHGGGQ